MAVTAFYCFVYSADSFFYHNLTWLYVGSWVPHIFIDLVLLGLPVPLLWKLQMQRTHKLILTGVFACGGLYVALLLFQLRGIIPRLYLGLGSLPDKDLASSVTIISIIRLANLFGKASSNTIVWTTVEVNSSIICGQYKKASSY